MKIRRAFPAVIMLALLAAPSGLSAGLGKHQHSRRADPVRASTSDQISREFVSYAEYSIYMNGYRLEAEGSLLLNSALVSLDCPQVEISPVPLPTRGVNYSFGVLNYKSFGSNCYSAEYHIPAQTVDGIEGTFLCSTVDLVDHECVILFYDLETGKQLWGDNFYVLVDHGRPETRYFRSVTNSPYKGQISGHLGVSVFTFLSE